MLKAQNQISKKRYILQKFKYREYAENYSKKVKKGVSDLEKIPKGHGTTGFQYRGYDIYLKPCESNLIFYVVSDIRKTVTVLRVLQDGMDWQYIVQQWLSKNIS